jgi:hypothetical protein
MAPIVSGDVRHHLTGSLKGSNPKRSPAGSGRGFFGGLFYKE